MGDAALMQQNALGKCEGKSPWLGPYVQESCGEPSRLLIRTASNAYFPQVMSVISLPDRDEKVKAAVDGVWEFIAEVEDLEMLKYERRKARVNAALEGISDEEVLAEVQARRGEKTEQPKSVKQAELETLVASRDEIGEDKADGNFFARALPRDRWDKPWMQPIQRVVLVHRLREVVALAGFTRFEALAPGQAFSERYRPPPRPAKSLAAHDAPVRLLLAPARSLPTANGRGGRTSHAIYRWF